MITNNEIRNGIAAYAHEQKAIKRLLSFKKGFSELDFDRWLKGREFRKNVPLRGPGICGDSFLVGIGANGFNEWARWLEILQWMIRLREVDAVKRDGIIHYSLLGGGK